MARELLVATRLGVRFTDRDLEPLDVFRRRLHVVRLASQRFVSSFSRCVGWIIETDPVWYDLLAEEVSACRLRPPPKGSLVISRRGTSDEAADLRELGLSGRRLLTVRLDSDDVYLEPAMHHALDLADSQEDGVLVDFPSGYLLQPQEGGVRKYSYNLQGPFLGFTSTGVDLRRIHGEHAKARSRADGVLRIPERAWVQTVHGHNILTSFEAPGLPRRLRQFRRGVARNPEERPPADLIKFLGDFIPPRDARRRHAIAQVAPANQWAATE